MRKNLGVKQLLYPQPVLMIATYDEHDVPDIMVAAWGSIADYDKVFISISKDHKTTKNILANKAFTISAAIKKFVVNEDYLGIVSANEKVDKVKHSSFTVTKSTFVNAPIIDELPLTLECELISYDETSEFLFGKIINVSCDESILKENGRIDVRKFEPLIFDPSNHRYYAFGEVVGSAFSDGEKLL